MLSPTEKPPLKWAFYYTKGQVVHSFFKLSTGVLGKPGPSIKKMPFAGFICRV